MLSSLAVAAAALAVSMSRERFVQAQSANSAASAAAPMSQNGRETLAWGAGYSQWFPVTGYLFSRSHGSRLVTIRATPMPGAQLYVRNAEAIHNLRPDEVKSYPVGTLIAMATWSLGADYSRSAPGPIFFMKKEPPGYDSQGGDWRYAMTRADLSILAEGKDGPATECRTCHLNAKAWDCVYAIYR